MFNMKDNEGVLKVTIWKWLTWKWNSIEGVWIEPNIIIPLNIKEYIENDKYNQLEEAIKQIKW